MPCFNAPPRDTLAPGDERELRYIANDTVKPAFEKRTPALLENVISRDIAFVSSNGEHTEGWALAKYALSVELDILQPTLENVTIYLDMEGKEAFAFDEEDADLRTSFRLKKIDDAWRLTLIDFTGEERFLR